MNGTGVERIAELFVERARVEVGQQADAELVRRHVRSLILDWWEATPGVTAGEARQILATARGEAARRSPAPASPLPLAA